MEQAIIDFYARLLLENRSTYDPLTVKFKGVIMGHYAHLLPQFMDLETQLREGRLTAQYNVAPTPRSETTTMPAALHAQKVWRRAGMPLEGMGKSVAPIPTFRRMGAIQTQGEQPATTNLLAFPDIAEGVRDAETDNTKKFVTAVVQGLAIAGLEDTSRIREREAKELTATPPEQMEAIKQIHDDNAHVLEPLTPDDLKSISNMTAKEVLELYPANRLIAHMAEREIEFTEGASDRQIANRLIRYLKENK